MSHSITKCRGCQCTITQCRCMAKDKTVILGVCVTCRKAGVSDMEEPTKPKLEHPDKVSIPCARCKKVDAVYKFPEVVFGYGDTCAPCHDYIKALQVEFMRAVARWPEMRVAAMIQQLNEGPSGDGT